MTELTYAIGLFGLYSIVIHNAIMVHMIAQKHEDINPIIPDGGKP